MYFWHKKTGHGISMPRFIQHLLLHFLFASTFRTKSVELEAVRVYKKPPLFYPVF